MRREDCLTRGLVLTVYFVVLTCTALKGTAEQSEYSREIWQRRFDQMRLAKLHIPSNDTTYSSHQMQERAKRFQTYLSKANFYNKHLGNYSFPRIIEPHNLKVVMQEDDLTLMAHYSKAHNDQDKAVIQDLESYMEKLHKQLERASPDIILPSEGRTQQDQESIDELEELHGLHQELQRESETACKRVEALGKSCIAEKHESEVL